MSEEVKGTVSADEWHQLSDLLGELVESTKDVHTRREAEASQLKDAIERLRGSASAAARGQVDRMQGVLDERKHEVELVHKALDTLERLYGAIGALQQRLTKRLEQADETSLRLTALEATQQTASQNETELRKQLGDRDASVAALQSALDALTGIGASGLEVDDAHVVEETPVSAASADVLAPPSGVSTTHLEEIEAIPLPAAAPSVQVNRTSLVRATPRLGELKNAAPADIRLAGILSHWDGIDVLRLSEISKMPEEQVLERLRVLVGQGLVTIENEAMSAP